MIQSLDEFIKLDVSAMKDQLEEWNNAYYNADAPLVSDQLYDLCSSYYQNLTGTELESVPGQATDSFKKYKHNYPVLSLGKITTRDQYDTALNKFDNKVLVEPKVDGLTVVYYPDGKLVSRGNGIEGEILPYAHLIPRLPKPIDKPVRMEVYIAKVIFNANFANSNKNARNTASGIIRRKTYSNDIKFLSYVAYNILGSTDSNQTQLETLAANGFDTVDYMTIEPWLTKDKIYDSMEVWSHSFPYETDGVVIKSNEPNSLAKYGSTGHHPNDMIAYKFQSLTATTVLRDIEWSYGRDCITPVAIFDPVELGGTTVSRASVHNVNIAKDLKLAIGSNVIVTKKNEIIPQIIYCDSAKFALHVPDTCPVCKQKLSLSDKGILSCTNEKCPGLLLSHCEKMSSKDGLNIMGLSTATWLKKLAHVDSGYIPFQFIHEAKISYGTSTGRYGLTPHVLNKIYKATIDAATNCELHRFLVACDIPLLGRTASKLLEAKYGHIIPFLDHYKTDTEPIEGIGKVIRQSIIDNLDYIRLASSYIISFKDAPVKKLTHKSLKFVITGTLSQPRKVFEEKITAAGHEACSSLSKKTDYLICGTDCGSKKAKAEKLGVKIIAEEELDDLLK